MKTTRLLIIALLCVGLASAANAGTKHGHAKKKKHAGANNIPNGLTFVTTQNVNPDSEAATLAAAQSVFNDPDIVDCFRADSTGTFINSAGTFTITLVKTNKGPTYDITWALSAGQVLEGVYLKGGNNGNFYSAGETNAGTGNGHAPVAGRSRKFASLSHLDFFCEPGQTPPPTVPDGGSAVTLLGLALGGVEGVRRMIRARKA
jgi:hypothetical protein